MSTILVIDDEEQFRKMLVLLLKNEGYQVIDAANGNLGLQKFRKDVPNLTVIDIFMPEKEGLETIQEIKAEQPTAKVIAISGGGRQGVVSYLKYAEMFGADRAFSKPFDPPEFLKAVKELLHQ